MAQPRFKLAQASGMVMVAMSAKRNHRPFSQHRDIFGNRSQAKARINNQSRSLPRTCQILHRQSAATCASRMCDTPSSRFLILYQLDRVTHHPSATHIIRCSPFPARCRDYGRRLVCAASMRHPKLCWFYRHNAVYCREVLFN